jgi:nitrogen fixation NifU-like protein
MALDDLYKEIILDHYQNPRHRHELDHPDVATRGHNPLCGDEVMLGLKLDGDTIVDIGTGGRGCSISQAAASMMAERVVGGSVEDATRLANAFREMMSGSGDGSAFDEDDDLLALQGVKRFPVRVKCAMLPWSALLEAIDLARARR